MKRLTSGTHNHTHVLSKTPKVLLINKEYIMVLHTIVTIIITLEIVGFGMFIYYIAKAQEIDEHGNIINKKDKSK